MSNVLITGANGQLGQCLRVLEKNNIDLVLFFTDRQELDITNSAELKHYFEINSIDWCINCAAYTSVDLAESEKEKAQLINATAVGNLAKISAESNVKIIHISTDFVFEGTQNRAYTEEDLTKPLSCYGQSKLDGEILLAAHNSKYFILRTSWLYSEFNHNFLKTMLQLTETRKEIGVVVDQIGTPTYAKDLAGFILDIINKNSSSYGLYNYSNEGVASWYDFAKTIFDIFDVNIKVNAIGSVSFPTPAKRPSFSVLDKSKIKKTFGIEIPYWKDSLKLALSNL